MENIKVSLSLLAAKPKFSWQVGDVLELVYEDFSGRWKVRKFTGICISRVCRGGAARYTLRNVFNNIPVELSFDYDSPLVVSLSKAQVYKSTSRSRSKLFYLRRRRITDSKV
jgi:ribosomal protein L19